MNDYPTPARPGDGRPTPAEVAALTRRLRELSTPGRTVDPRERAAFLADKDALLARITDTGVRAEQAGGELHRHDAHPDRPAPTDQTTAWWARAESPDPGIPPVTFDASGYYSDAQLAAIAAAREAGDHEQAEALQNAPWTAQGATADTAHTAVTDDPHAEPYVAVTRARADWDAVRGDDPRSYSEMMGDAARAFHDAPRPDVEENQARREQLTRWHHDDHPDGGHYVTDLGVPMGPRAVDDGVDRQGDGDGAGWDR